MDTRTSDLRPPQPLRTGDRAPRVTRLRRATLATIAAVGVMAGSAPLAGAHANPAPAPDPAAGAPAPAAPAGNPATPPLGTSLMHRDMNSSDSVPWSGPGQGQAVK